MKEKLKKFFIIADRTRGVFVDNAMNVYSGFAAFYLLLSLIPLIVLLVAAIGLISEDYLVSFSELMEEIFPSIPQVQSLLTGIMENIRGISALVISVSAVSLLWSATSGVSAIQLGLNRICSANQSMIKRRAACLLYTLVFIILIPILIVFRVLRSSVIELVKQLDEILQMPDIATKIVNVLENSGLLTFIAMFLIILLAYSVLPSRRRYWRYQIPGAVFTVLLWSLFSKIFDFFIIRFWSASFLYGSLAAIFLLALWMNYIMIILFLGASLNEALYEKGYWPETGGGYGKIKSGRRTLCVYLLFAMIGLACILSKWIS